MKASPLCTSIMLDQWEAQRCLMVEFRISQFSYLFLFFYWFLYEMENVFELVV